MTSVSLPFLKEFVIFSVSSSSQHRFCWGYLVAAGRAVTEAATALLGLNLGNDVDVDGDVVELFQGIIKSDFTSLTGAKSNWE